MLVEPEESATADESALSFDRFNKTLNVERDTQKTVSNKK